MSTTPKKNKQATPEQSKVNPTVTETEATADAASDARVRLGLGPSGVYGADDGIIVADATTEPHEDDNPNPDQA